MKKLSLGALMTEVLRMLSHSYPARNFVTLLLSIGVVAGSVGGCFESEEQLRVFSWEVAALSGILLLIMYFGEAYAKRSYGKALERARSTFQDRNFSDEWIQSLPSQSTRAMSFFVALFVFLLMFVTLMLGSFAAHLSVTIPIIVLIAFFLSLLPVTISGLSHVLEVKTLERLISQGIFIGDRATLETTVIAEGENMLRARGALIIFTLVSTASRSVILFSSLLPAFFPSLAPLNFLHLASPYGATCSVMAYNAFSLFIMAPHAFQARLLFARFTQASAGRALFVYGLSGVILPLLCIKAISLIAWWHHG